MESTRDDDDCGQIPPRIVEVQAFPLELHGLSNHLSPPRDVPTFIALRQVIRRMSLPFVY